jgi:mono/diheme cytochrome c family protein
MTLKAIATAIVMAIGVLGIFSAGARARTSTANDFDAAASYKTMKCATCHGPKAEKKFDTTKSDDEHVQIILKGKKPEKPPNMPAYEAKGVTEDQAKALLTYMKSLRQ